MRRIRRSALGAAGLTAALVLTGCGASGDAAGGESPRSQSASEQHAGGGSTVQAMTAVAKKTSDATAAKVSLKISSPGMLGEEMEMSGVMGWDPMALDMTMRTADTPAMPSSSRLIWVDDAMYVDMGSVNAAELDGKRWMKLDLGSALDQLGQAERKMLSGGLDSMNGQDPAQQMALLLSSPNVAYLGEQEVDGVTAKRYKGTLTLDDGMKSKDGLDFLSAAEREDLLEGVKKSGIKGYEIEAWVRDDLPVRIKTTMDSSQGDVTVLQKLTDYGTDVSVKAPPAEETADFREALRGILGQGR